MNVSVLLAPNIIALSVVLVVFYGLGFGVLQSIVNGGMAYTFYDWFNVIASLNAPYEEC